MTENSFLAQDVDLAELAGGSSAMEFLELQETLIMLHWQKWQSMAILHGAKNLWRPFLVHKMLCLQRIQKISAVLRSKGLWRAPSHLRWIDRSTCQTSQSKLMRQIWRLVALTFSLVSWPNNPWLCAEDLWNVGRQNCGVAHAYGSFRMLADFTFK